MKLISILLMFLALNQVSGQTKKYKIDAELNACLDSAENQSTHGTIICISRATVKWDKELNENYKELMLLLTAEQKNKLKTAQRQWIVYRDKEIEFSNKLYSDMEGTMWQPIAIEKKLKLTKDRAIELDDYIMNLKIDE